MKYAKLISETAIDTNVPRRAVQNGGLVVGDLTGDPELLASLGFLPLDETPQPSPAVAGFHYEARYEVADGRIVQTWGEVRNPPRTFSKLRIVGALIDAGYWPQVKAYIESAGLYDLYLAAQTFREDDPHFAPALAALKDALAVPDATAETILAAAAVD